MMLEALIAAALRSSALTAIVWLLLKTLRLRDPRLQLIAWTIVLAASLAMPFATRLAIAVAPRIMIPQIAFDGIPSPINEFSVSSQSSLIETSVAPAAASRDAPTTIVGSSRSLATLLLSWRGGAAALIVYGTVAGVLLARLLVGLWLTMRIVRVARPLSECLTSGRDVRVSDSIDAPATFGSVILLPGDSQGWSRAKRAAVLAHEAAHVDHGDFYVQTAAHLNRIVFWFNPTSWWLQRKLSNLAEAASDDAAVARLRDRLRYAEILLDISRRVAVPGNGVAMAKPATIRARIDRILAEHAIPPVASRRGRAALGALVLPFAVLAAGPLAYSSGSPPGSSAGGEDELAPHQRISIDPALLDADVGYYEDKASGTVLTVTREGDHLIVCRTGRSPLPEYPYTDHDFFLTTAAEQDSFLLDAAGAVVRVIRKKYGLATTYERISAERAGRLEDEYDRRVTEELEPRTPVKLDASLLDRYVGYYRLNSIYLLAITREGDQLFAQGTEQKRFAVFAYSDRDFFYTVVAAQLSFQGPPGATATSLILHQDGRDRVAPRVSADVASAFQQRLDDEIRPRNKAPIDNALLDAYVGNYASPILAMSVTREGDHLLARVLGYTKYRVYPYTDHDFFATTLAAQVSFVRDARGRAIQMIRHEHGEDIVMSRVE